MLRISLCISGVVNVSCHFSIHLKETGSSWTHVSSNCRKLESDCLPFLAHIWPCNGHTEALSANVLGGPLNFCRLNSFMCSNASQTLLSAFFQFENPVLEDVVSHSLQASERWHLSAINRRCPEHCHFLLDGVAKGYLLKRDRRNVHCCLLKFSCGNERTG